MAVFLFYGEDVFRQKKKLAFWKREFERKHGGDMNISILDGKNISAGDVIQACSAVPFLGEKRLVIAQNFLAHADETSRADMAEALTNIPDFTVLVFSETEGVDRRTVLYKRLQKNAAVEEFTPIVGSELIAWINKQVAGLGASIETGACILLAEISGGDLYRLENEVRKLAAYANDRSITKKDIELLTDTQLSTSIFKLTDAIGNRNHSMALATLHHLVETGEQLHQIFSMIMRQFRMIVEVKDLADSGHRQHEIATKIKEHPFAVSSTLMQIKNYSADQLREAYRQLVELDSKLKGGGIKQTVGDNRDFLLALDKLVVNLCQAKA